MFSLDVYLFFLSSLCNCRCLFAPPTMFSVDVYLFFLPCLSNCHRLYFANGKKWGDAHKWIIVFRPLFLWSHLFLFVRLLDKEK